MKPIRKAFTNLTDRQVVFLLTAMAFLTATLSAFFNSDSLKEWLSGWMQNFSTEMLGAVLTFVLLQLIVGARQEKHRLMRDLRSSLPDVARRAAEEMHSAGWLYDGTLQGADLIRANLQGVELLKANLDKATLDMADLQGADLSRANLYQAHLFGTNLQDVNFFGALLAQAKLYKANLQHANLCAVNLQDADLTGADLQDANLSGANLLRTRLNNVSFSESTILPDGSNWHTTVDMTRFTNPDHPQCWKPPAEPFAFHLAQDQVHR